MKIEILSNEVVSRDYTTKSGDKRRSYSQAGYMWLDGDKYPKECRIPLQSADAYKPGMYTLDETCFRVGNFGDIEINRFEMRLIALPEKPLNFASVAGSK